MSDAGRVRDHFDKVAAAYDGDSAGGMWARLRATESRAVMGLLEPKPGEAILDAGSGAGYYAERIVRAGAQCTAMDFSAAMLAALRERLSVETIEGDMATVPFPPSFGKVLCAGALEFVPDPAAAVRNLASALSPKGPGVVVLLMPRRGVAPAIYRLFHRAHGFRVHLFGIGDIQRMAADAGLRLAASRRVTFNWVVRLVRA